MRKLFLFSALFITLVFSPVIAMAENSSDIIDKEAFSKWMADFYNRALEKGITKSTLDSALAGVKPLPQAVILDRKQPEKTITFKEYMARVVPYSRVAKGKKMLKQNKVLLDEISKKYKVEPRFIVALWGIETDFGTNTGDFHILDALATLAFEGRRGEFFEEELINALKIIDDGHITSHKMIGSWAGAMGQIQFMPTSFLKYAVDYDGDGRKDIWNSKSDIFASVANYLSKNGWQNNGIWGSKVIVPEGFDIKLSDGKVEKQIQEWQALGLRTTGVELPKGNDPISMIMPGGEKTDAFLIYPNYKVLLKWNRSLYFASAVTKLADSINQ